MKQIWGVGYIWSEQPVTNKSVFLDCFLRVRGKLRQMIVRNEEAIF